MEVEVVDAQGKSIPIRLSATLLLEDGVEVGSVGFFHDLTARKQLEEELLRRSSPTASPACSPRHFHPCSCTRWSGPTATPPLDPGHVRPGSLQAFNDNYGHQEGDNILRLVSRTLRDGLRHLDHAFRLGGDEFAALLVETDLAQGFLAVERFRRAFNQAWSAKMASWEASCLR